MHYSKNPKLTLANFDYEVYYVLEHEGIFKLQEEETLKVNFSYIFSFRFG